LLYGFGVSVGGGLGVAELEAFFTDPSFGRVGFHRVDEALVVRCDAGTVSPH